MPLATTLLAWRIGGDDKYKGMMEEDECMEQRMKDPYGQREDR